MYLPDCQTSALAILLFSSGRKNGDRKGRGEGGVTRVVKAIPDFRELMKKQFGGFKAFEDELGLNKWKEALSSFLIERMADNQNGRLPTKVKVDGRSIGDEMLK